MRSPRQIRNVALVGFMGAGKTTVGRLVAQYLGFEFVDTDQLIERRAGATIPEIFARQGETAFRESEREVIAELTLRSGHVIATGGGLVCQPGNLEHLKAHALVVCLWASPETLWQRVRHQARRPLLNVPDPHAEMLRLLEERAPFYRQADVLVNTGSRSSREVAQQVVHQFNLARASQSPP